MVSQDADNPNSGGAEAEHPVSELIEELGEGGEFVEQGAFSLDPLEARNKLRAYQLAEPNGYLLLLVEAACLAAPPGREPEIRFSLGRELRAEFISLPLETDELEGLLGGVFRSLEGLEGEALARARTLRLLGLAVNAALALEPKQLSVEYVSTTGQSVGVRFDPAGPVERFERELEGGTRARVRFELHFPVLDNLSMADERALLRIACRFAPFLVEVDGERVDGGRQRWLDTTQNPRSVTRPVMLEGEEIGVATKLEDTDPAQLMIVTRGVLSEVLELPEKIPGFRAFIDIDLRKDLSQALVVRDAAFERVLDAVAHVHDELPELEPEPKPKAPRPRAQHTEKPGASRHRLLIGFAAVMGVIVLASYLQCASKDRGKELPPRVTEDDPRAKLKCEPKSPRKCLRRAQYELELGGPDSGALAREMLTQACEDEDDACLQLRALSGPLIAGQRWLGSFSCDGRTIPVVLDVSARRSAEGELRYQLEDTDYRVRVELHAKGRDFATLRERWIFPKQMRGQDGPPAFTGKFRDSKSISGTVRNANCSRFSLALESGVRPESIPH